MTLRIAYAGIIQFTAQLLTLFTGLIFVALVTRNLTIEEFGLWQILGSSLGLLLIPLAPLSYWTVRYSARGYDVGKTSLLAGVMSIPIFVIVYLMLALTASASIEAILFFVLLYMIQIPALCVWTSVKPIAMAYKPQYLGYATIVLEIGKILGAYYTIAILNLGLTGAILALTLGQFFQLVVIIYVIKPKLRGTFNFSILKKWYKTSWIPIASVSASRLSIADSIVVSVILGSTTVVGLFQASRVFTLIVRYSETFLRVLNPKLIRDNKYEDIVLTLRLQALVAVPLVAGAWMLSESLLGILGVQYMQATNVLRILTIVAVLEGIEVLIWSILTGIEKSDQNIEDLQFNKLKNSWLIKIPLIDLTKYAIYFPILAIIMYISRGNGNELSLSMYWAIILLLVTIPITIYKIILVKRVIKLEIPKLSILTYIISGIVMSGFLYYYTQLIPLTKTSTIEIILYIIPPGMASVLIYSIVVITLDSFARKMIKDLINRKN